jgi:hypothetical protein
MSPRWLLVAGLSILVSSCRSGADRPSPEVRGAPSEELGRLEPYRVDRHDGTQSCANHDREIVVEDHASHEGSEPAAGVADVGGEPNRAFLVFLLLG